MSKYQIAVVVGSLRGEAGNIGADSKQFLQNWMDQYVAWAKRHAA